MLKFYFGKVSFDKLPSKELTEKYNDFYAINQLLKDGKIFKVAHGIYSDVGPRLAELECLFA